ncbi:hypothetical protein [Pedobacter rhodius]|uniref:TerB family tellurite resistance protein n=1 Tax=Pedobacter rhodius TaxID=3004098 RepID=A0ABT4KX84_9SPHI|nr:hypothetical protein [Pedobacter sp. SJ11]MCZ4223519.1 hypothetical protein [Pedobacter sp. SJ11]
MESTKFKTIVFFVVAVLCSITSNAQTYAEFFRQKKTQKKYLIEQLVALKVYAGYLKKGYDIASDGINTVKDLSKGEFNLHNSFISSLKAVSPAIKNNGKVVDIIILQLDICQLFGSIGKSKLLDATTLRYVDQVRDNVVGECEKDLDELLLVITSGKVEMKDDERLKRLENIYLRMVDKSQFVQHFANQLEMFGRQKQHEEQYIHDLKKLYETNN